MVKRHSGFTLVEILIVMVIVGLMAGIAVLAIGANPHQQLNQEAQRLRAVVQLAADEALLEGQEYGIKLAERGYQVLRFDEQQQIWIAADQPSFAAYSLPEAITLSLQSEGSAIDLRALYQNDEELNAAQGSRQQEKLKPSVLLLSSGEMTAFSLQLSSADTSHTLVMTGSGLGDIRVDTNSEN